MRNGWLLVPALAGCVTLAACEDGTGPGGGDGTVQLSFATASAAGASFDRGPLPGEAATSAVSDVKIDAVELVLAKVRLQQQHEERDCDEVEDEHEHESEHEDGEHSLAGTACEQFRSGPVLVSLPLDGSAITPFEMRPTPGSYDRIEFQIHRPEGSDASAREFFAAHGDWPARASIHVRGRVTTGGENPQTVPFETYLSTEAKLRQRFDPPLVVSDTTDLADLNVTVSVDVDRWFRNADGSYLDPRELTTSAHLLEQVEHNVRESFRAKHEHGRGRGRGRHGDD